MSIVGETSIGGNIGESSEHALYPWQRHALREWRQHEHRGIVEAVTGAGKTRLGIEAIAERLAGGGKCVIVVPGRYLLHQWSAVIRAALPNVNLGLLGDERRDDFRRVQVLVATVNLARSTRFGLCGVPGLLVADECHRYGSDVNRIALVSEFDWRLGLSATHERADGSHLSVVEPYFGGVVFRYSYAEAIAEGVVARFRVALIGVAFSDDERERYDYLSKKLSRARTQLLTIYKVPAEPFGVFMNVLNELSVHGNQRESIAAGRYLAAFNQRRALLAETETKIAALVRLEHAITAASRVIVFTQTVTATRRVYDELVDLGVDAGCLHSQMDAAERKDVLNRFRQGHLHVIVAPQLLDEGLDIPDADFGIIVAASRQRRQMIQRMGRCLRPKKNGGNARFAILFVQGTSEDPRQGAHEAFLNEVTGPADAVREFDLYDTGAEICEFLTPTETRCTLPATTVKTDKIMHEWKETRRAIVFPWNCDNYGHMNVRFFFDHFDDASFHSWPAIGCPQTFLAEHGVSTVMARYVVNYVNEVAPGTLLVISSALTRVGNRSVAFTHEMRNCETGDLCATMDAVEVLFDTQSRASTVMPEPVRDKLMSLLVETDGVSGVKKPLQSNPQATGNWHEVHRGLVFPWRCDHYGHMNARWYAHHFDDGGFHLFSMAGVNVSGLLEQKRALVTAQTEINFIKELNPGELFVVRSGFSHVGTKSARHLHRMYNVQDGTLHATMEGTDVMFDLEQRAAIVIPDELRQIIGANLIDPSA